MFFGMEERESMMIDDRDDTNSSVSQTKQK